MSPDVLRPNSLYFPHIKRDFMDRGLEEQSYQIFNAEPFQQSVQTVVFTKVGRESLETEVGTIDVVVHVATEMNEVVISYSE